jgi:hypothetical protein
MRIKLTRQLVNYNNFDDKRIKYRTVNYYVKIEALLPE